MKDRLNQQDTLQEGERTPPKKRTQLASSSTLLSPFSAEGSHHYPQIIQEVKKVYADENTENAKQKSLSIFASKIIKTPPDQNVPSDDLPRYYSAVQQFLKAFLSEKSRFDATYETYHKKYRNMIDSFVNRKASLEIAKTELESIYFYLYSLKPSQLSANNNTLSKYSGLYSEWVSKYRCHAMNPDFLENIEKANDLFVKLIHSFDAKTHRTLLGELHIVMTRVSKQLRLLTDEIEVAQSKWQSNKEPNCISFFIVKSEDQKEGPICVLNLSSRELAEDLWIRLREFTETYSDNHLTFHVSEAPSRNFHKALNHILTGVLNTTTPNRPYRECAEKGVLETIMKGNSLRQTHLTVEAIINLAFLPFEISASETNLDSMELMVGGKRYGLRMIDACNDCKKTFPAGEALLAIQPKLLCSPIKSDIKTSSTLFAAQKRSYQSALYGSPEKGSSTQPSTSAIQQASCNLDKVCFSKL